MADKKGLPAPPDLLGSIVSSLTGSQPVAFSRITRTPIYTTSGWTWPQSKGGEYDNGAITMRAPVLQEEQVVPHESAHALYDQGGLTKRPVPQGAPLPAVEAEERIASHPELYPPKNPHYDQILANENLAFSIGHYDGTPLVEYVAKRIGPELGQKLLRLHYNAMMSKPLPR